MDQDQYAISAEQASLIIEAVSARMNQLVLWMERATTPDQEAYYRSRIGHCQRLLDALQFPEDRTVFRVRLSGAEMGNQRAVQRIDEAIRDEPLPARSNWDPTGAWINTYLTEEAAEKAARVWERAGLDADLQEPPADMP